MRQEVIVLEPDPELRALLRALLQSDGYRVTEAEPARLQDVLRASKARTVLAPPDANMRFGNLIDNLRAQRPDLDVLTPMGYGVSILEGAAERDAVSEFARDALLLLSVLAEEGTRRPQTAEKIGRLSELTAIKLGLSRAHVETCSAAASLVALGPSLAAFRFSVAATEDDSAQPGLSRELAASVAALSAMRCPFDLRPVIESVEEHFDGRGRPRGLSGEAIPISARIVAVTREYAQTLAKSQDATAATEAIRSRVGSMFDPGVVDGFFKALRDESYLERMESGGTGARVLLVDSDEADLAVAEMRLSSAGFRVSVAKDGNKAFEMITTNPPDVVVSDTVLPRLDGISMLLKLRRHPAAKGVPVIFTSSRTDAGLLNKALKLGAKDVLAKPVNFEILIAKMRTLSTQVQAATQQASSGIVGELAEMPLTDFLQVLALGRKTVKVSISSTSGQGEIYFDSGSPAAAFAEGSKGVSAFTEILTWSDGTFTLTNAEGAPEVNLFHTLDALILQTAWERKNVADGGTPSSAAATAFSGVDFGKTGVVGTPFQYQAPAPAPEPEPVFQDSNPYPDANPYQEAPQAPANPYEEPVNPYGAPAPAPAPALPQAPAAFPSTPYDPDQFGTPTIGHDDDDEDDVELDFGNSADNLNPFNL